MLPACWKNNRLEKSVIQIYTKKFTPKNGWLKSLYTKIWLVHQKNFHLGQQFKKK
jgi:hypothetical protein